MNRRNARGLFLIAVLLLCILAWLTSPWWLGYVTNAYNRVENGLYIGGAVDHPPLGTRAVLNVCEQKDTFIVHTNMWEPFPGNPTVEWLARVVDFVAEQRAAGRTIYVHCLAGETRSATVVVAYLMREHGWRRDEAIAFLKSRRPQLKLPPYMIRLLDKWQEKLNVEQSHAEE